MHTKVALLYDLCLVVAENCFLISREYFRGFFREPRALVHHCWWDCFIKIDSRTKGLGGLHKLTFAGVWVKGLLTISCITSSLASVGPTWTPGGVNVSFLVDVRMVAEDGEWEGGRYERRRALAPTITLPLEREVWGRGWFEFFCNVADLRNQIFIQFIHWCLYAHALFARAQSPGPPCRA